MTQDLAAQPAAFRAGPFGQQGLEHRLGDEDPPQHPERQIADDLRAVPAQCLGGDEGHRSFGQGPVRPARDGVGLPPGGGFGGPHQAGAVGVGEFAGQPPHHLGGGGRTVDPGQGRDRTGMAQHDCGYVHAAGRRRPRVDAGAGPRLAGRVDACSDGIEEFLARHSRVRPVGVTAMTHASQGVALVFRGHGLVVGQPVRVAGAVLLGSEHLTVGAQHGRRTGRVDPVGQDAGPHLQEAAGRHGHVVVGVVVGDQTAARGSHVVATMDAGVRPPQVRATMPVAHMDVVVAAGERPPRVGLRQPTAHSQDVRMVPAHRTARRGVRVGVAHRRSRCCFMVSSAYVAQA